MTAAAAFVPACMDILVGSEILSMNSSAHLIASYPVSCMNKLILVFKPVLRLFIFIFLFYFICAILS